MVRQRSSELADFYGVPVSALMPDSEVPVATEAPAKLIIDLEALAQVFAERAGSLARYAATIQSRGAGTTTARCCPSARRTCAPSP